MREFETLARQAVACGRCFSENLNVRRPADDDVAQPRWIGVNYWTTKPKILIVLTNPGAGKNTDQSIHRKRRDLLRRFSIGEATLQEIFVDQFGDFPNWGNPPGRFTSYIRSSLGLSFDNIALMNIAWCAAIADGTDSYPKAMLTDCFELHTKQAMRLLSPDIIGLCGGEAHSFETKMKAVLPSARTHRLLHYAHRKSREEEALQCEEFRALVRSG